MSVALIASPARSRAAPPVIFAPVHRQLSTSTVRPFFFFNKPKSSQDDPKLLLRDIYAASKSGRLDLLPKLYANLTKAPLASHQLQHSDLTALLKALAPSQRFSLLHQVFTDIPRLCRGASQNYYDHHYLLQGLLGQGELQRALTWLVELETEYGLRPRLVECNLLLNAYRRQGDDEGIASVLQVIDKYHLPPDVYTYNALVSYNLERHNLPALAAVLEQMRAAGIAQDPVTETALMLGYLDLGDLKQARASRDRLTTLLATIPAAQRDPAALNALVKYAAVAHGQPEALALAQRYRNQGCRLDQQMVATLAAASPSQPRSFIEATRFIDELERATGVAADRHTWGLLIHAGLALDPLPKSAITTALQLYQEALDRSIPPGATLLQPLLQALLVPVPTSEALTIAKSLYEDFVSSPASKHHLFAPDSSTYATLLQASANPAVLDLDFVNVLLRDMKERGVKLVPEMVVLYIIALLRGSSTWAEAFGFYDMIRAMDTKALDEAAYNQILQGFTQLGLEDAQDLGGKAPTTMVNEILSDMRQTGNPPTAKTYTILLVHYSQAAGSGGRPGRPDSNATAIAYVHSLIKLDHSMDPDTALFNALMNAYSHVGAFSSAFRIWDNLVAGANSGLSVDEISLSIILDTCGYAGGEVARARGRKIWKQYTDPSSPVGLNIKNWEAWVECLSRWGEYDEAEHVVFDLMTPATPGPAAQPSTYSILYKYSMRDEGRAKRLKARLIAERPEEWAMLVQSGVSTLQS